MWCLRLSNWDLFVERVLQVGGTREVESLLVLREVSLISIPPNLLQISISPNLLQLVGLLEGEVLVPEEVEFCLDGGLLLDDLLYLVGTGLPYHFDLCLKG